MADGCAQCGRDNCPGAPHCKISDVLNNTCEHCEVPLAWHADTLRGQLCDLNRAMNALGRVLLEEWQAVRRRWGQP